MTKENKQSSWKETERKTQLRKQRLVAAVNTAAQEDIIELAEQLGKEDIYGKGNILFIAAQEGFGTVVDHILTNEPNITPQNLNSALIEAVEGNHPNIVKYLIEKGADINYTDSRGSSPLGLATHYGYREIIAQLNNAVNQAVSPEINLAENKLRVALEHRDEETAIEIINNEMDTNQLNTRITKDGSTALMLASYKGLKATIPYLLAKDVELEYINKYGTALTFAMYHESLGHNDISIALIAKGASLYESENLGTLVRNAMFENNPNQKKILKLVDSMHDVDREVYSEMTAVELAAYLGNKEVVEKLIERGASLTHPSKKRDKIRSSADKTDNTKEGADRSNSKRSRENANALHCAIHSGNIETVELILATTANLKTIDKNGNEIAYIDILDNNEVSPLKKAQSLGYTDIVKLLEEKGANQEIGAMPHQNLDETQIKQYLYYWWFRSSRCWIGLQGH